ncbi:DUF1294 domain-containing protein [Devosia submarina]|uniref:DUF1294 domain-containing protein n=1 Tax=Devosia submarina TaxID=1173082 RepID=UPI0013004CA5|nr:DUF1294 domain-containing protein [Devosia submarina]
MTRRSGELVQWNNKGGYGFVRDGTGRDFYLHISKVAGERPRIGDKVDFELATGRNGRPAAVDARVLEEMRPRVTSLPEALRSPPSISRYKLGLRVGAATMMTLLILFGIGMDNAPVWLAVLYAGMGLASAMLYRFDKIYALTDRWRVSETNLHAVDLSFGIIGGLCAQEFYRHKTVKPRFVAATWAIALFHTLLLASISFGWLELLLPQLG